MRRHRDISHPPRFRRFAPDTSRAQGRYEGNSRSGVRITLIRGAIAELLEESADPYLQLAEVLKQLVRLIVFYIVQARYGGRGLNMLSSRLLRC